MIGSFFYTVIFMRVIDKQDYEIYSLDYMLRRERSLLLEQAQAELWNNEFWLYDFMEVSRRHNYLEEFYLVGKEPDVHDAEVYLHRLLKKFSSFYGISCTRFTQKKKIQFYLGFCAFGKSSKKKYPLRNEIIVSVNRSGLSIRILAGHCLWGKSYYLYEYQIVGNVISDYIEKVLSENRECFDKFKKYREKLEQDSKEVSVKSLEIASSSIKCLYETSTENYKEIKQGYLYSVLYISGKESCIYHKDFLDEPNVLIKKLKRK